MAASLLPHICKIRAPLGGEKVYKDECVFSFDTPESDGGLYVCMNTFLGFSRKYVELHYRKTGNAVYLHLRKTKRLIPQEKIEGEPVAKKPTRLAIGVEGGFDVDAGRKKYEYDEENSVVVLPEFTVIPLPDDSLPPEVHTSVVCLLAADSAAKSEEAAALAGTWDGEQRPVSKYFDGTGGNNHAVEQYETTKYALAVKLGTVTPSGADVYSYDEDEMVEDPYLDKHLTHFGINITHLEKDNSNIVLLRLRRYVEPAEEMFQNGPLDPTGDFNIQMAKLGCGLCSGEYSKPPPEGTEDADEGNNLERAADWIFSHADELDVEDMEADGAGAQAIPARGQYRDGAGKYKLVGFISHMGTSTFVGHYVCHILKDGRWVIFNDNKVALSEKPPKDLGYLYLANMIERNSRNNSNPCDCFKFEVEERIECIQSKKVKYTYRTEYLLPLPIPLEAANNAEALQEYEEKKAIAEAAGQKLPPEALVRAQIPFTSCLQSAAAPETVYDFYSTALNGKTMALKNTRLASFPDYLLIQLKKFTIGSDWVPRKLDVSVNMPDTVDISMFRGSGLQPGEQELPEEAPPTVEPADVEIDDVIVTQLVEMGFAVEGCRKAVLNTRSQGIEAAMNWVMEHNEDPDFSQPMLAYACRARRPLPAGQRIADEH
ncbi:PREDICTED: ubiquitin carboxyl-terminal hydrolase 5-like [Priapulus caudatus]|uniref:ubiquitinyl hydrolase 1 n=1 Tax=Priapulus caudatus TaxID=37621 RepID=A0ABM1EZ98_PRICU|nr:PREDICTED: ubiquitin carboxyl-terminal hydrolase 5-like [Priapulus caudatus]